MYINKEELAKEVILKTVRAGGPGGQHVNKVETKVLLIWKPLASSLFSDGQKDILWTKLTSKVNKEGNIVLDACESRSQLRNKEIAVQKLIDIINMALIKQKKRIPTKVPKSVVLNRLDRKSKQASKKKWRKKNFNYD